MIERNYLVTGMHCQSCVELIEEEVNDLDGVDTVKVDLETDRASVRFDPERVDDKKVVDAIRNAGYDASPAT